MSVLGRLRPRPVTTGRYSAARVSTRPTGQFHVTGERLINPVKRRPWQDAAMGYYETLGEIWYAAQFYARAFAKLRIYVARVDENGEEVELESGPEVDAWNRIQDSGGGRSKLQARYGRLMFVIAECYLFLSVEDGRDVAEILSPVELKYEGKEWLRQRGPGRPVQKYTDAVDGMITDGTAVGYRMWRDHPVWSDEADGPMRGVLDECEELVIMTRAVRSGALSRIARSGMLLWPDDGMTPQDAGQDEDMEEDPVLADLGEHLSEAVEDPGSTAAYTPMLHRMQPELIEKVRLLQFTDDAKKYPEAELRTEAIERIALGLDFPPEIMLGKGDANHWSGWSVDDDAWKAHLEPAALQMAQDFAGAYLLPTLGYPTDIKLSIDAADVVNRPNRSSDAKDLHDRLVLSDEALRDANGFDDDDAPDEEEYARRVGVKLLDPEMAISGVPTEKPAPVIHVPGQPVDDGQPPEDKPGDNPGRSPQAPPAEKDAQASYHAMLMGASELMIERAREAAGARLRQILKGRGTVVPAAIPNRLVASHLGERAFITARREPDSLVAGACEPYRSRLEAWDFDPQTIDALVTACERQAAATLLDATFAIGDEVAVLCLQAGMLAT